MPKLPVLSCRDILRVLKKAGFEERRQKGSHIILKKNGVRVVVPCHGGKDLKKGTLAAIIEQAGLSAEDLAKYL